MTALQMDREAQALELERLNSERRRFHLPELVGFRTARGIGLGWEEGAEPLFEIGGGADGIFYRDLREPHIVVDESAITLASTQKALWAPARTILPANYWRVGKVVKLTAFCKATTGATPGNYAYAMAYGSGDAPTPIVASVARAAVASQTNIPLTIEGYMECRSIGAAGTCRMWGKAFADLALQLSTNQPNLFPSSAPADVTIDTTVGTNAVTFQMSRSGSTAETVTTVGLLFEALN
jgi:hypothetical protein